MAPWFNNDAFTSGLARIFFNSPFKRSITGAGVLAGATMPNMELTSKSFRPASAAVGTSGNASTRAGVVTANARSLPALMLPCAAGTVSIMLNTWPPIRSVMAGPLPL
ncbi:hypothetical protein D3C72_857700 [compost metagenome]